VTSRLSIPKAENLSAKTAQLAFLKAIFNYWNGKSPTLFSHDVNWDILKSVAIYNYLHSSNVSLILQLSVSFLRQFCTLTLFQELWILRLFVFLMLVIIFLKLI